jgi:hypothetical protein
LGISIAGLGALFLIGGGVAISYLNNLITPPTTEFALATVELCVAGAVLLPIGYAGFSRQTSGPTRMATLATGMAMGGILFGGGLYWEAVTSFP